MPKTKIHFMGLLANTDSSILNLKLSHGFEIKSLSYEKGIKFFSDIEKLPNTEIERKLSLDFPCLDPNEKKFYFISNSFETTNVRGIERINKEEEFNKKFVRGYLQPTIRIMRLFKEGNICMPRIYYYFVENDTIKGSLRKWTFLHISSRPRYTLELSEIPNLQKFIENIKLPFKEPFLQLAFENFELSYQTSNQNVAFVILMVALESLFSPGKRIQYNISRNTAALLSKSDEESQSIRKEIRELYRERCKIMHPQKKYYITNENLLKLRHYVRESIKEVLKTNKNKEDLLKLLTSRGFGNKLLEKG